MNKSSSFKELRDHYPNVALFMSFHARRGWRLRAEGPYGSLFVLLPDMPLRPATLEMACQLVSRSNVERPVHV